MHELPICFFGDSLVDRPSIIVDNPHFDLPAIGQVVPVRGHEKGGFYKVVSQNLTVAYPEQAFSFSNFAVGGSTVRDVERQVERACSLVPQTVLSVVCVGINDVIRAFQGRYAEGVNLDEFAERYTRIVARLCAHSSFVLCICEPFGDVGEGSGALRAELIRYNAVVSSIVSRLGQGKLACVDLFARFEQVNAALVARGAQIPLWVDGVHLSEVGNILAADAIMSALGAASLWQDAVVGSR
jgi:lysophospholipase L1-like esterase